MAKQVNPNENKENNEQAAALVSSVEAGKQSEVIPTPTASAETTKQSKAQAAPAASAKQMCVVCAEKKHLYLKKGSYDHIQCDFCGEVHTGGLESDYE